MRNLRGRRHDDPPKQGWPYRVGLMVKRFPIQTAVIVLVMILALPLLMILRQQHDIKYRNAQIVTLLREIQVQRRTSLSLLCTDNAIIVNVLGSIPAARRTPVFSDSLARARDIHCERLVRSIKPIPPLPAPKRSTAP